MSSKHHVDLLKGGVFAALVKLALPIMAGSLVGLAYNLTDMFWIGGVGASAVAAVGTGGIFIWIGEGVGAISRVGASTCCGQAIGRGDNDEAYTYGREAMRLAIVLSLIYAAFVFSFPQLLTKIFSFNETETIIQTETYIRIAALGFVPSVITRVSSAMFISSGNSRIPFLANTVGLAVNMVLDPLFIAGLGYGVAGAAAATVLAQCVVMAIMMVLRRQNQYWRHVDIFECKFELGAIREIVRLGYPAFLQIISFATLSMFVSRIVVKFGDHHVAAQRLGVQLESITWLTADGLGVAANAFVAQNFGAKQFSRVRHGYRTAVIVLSCYCLSTSAVLFIFAQSIAGLFFTSSLAIVAATAYITIISVSQIGMGLEIITVPSFAALGITFAPTVITVGLYSLRIPLAHFLSQTALGVNGIWLALSGTSLLTGLILVMGFWRYSKQLDERARM